MSRNSNGMSTGMAILCTLGILLFLGWMIDLSIPKCIKSGCDNDAEYASPIGKTGEPLSRIMIKKNVK